MKCEIDKAHISGDKDVKTTTTRLVFSRMCSDRNDLLDEQEHRHIGVSFTYSTEICGWAGCRVLVCVCKNCCAKQTKTMKFHASKMNWRRTESKESNSYNDPTHNHQRTVRCLFFFSSLFHLAGWKPMLMRCIVWVSSVSWIVWLFHVSFQYILTHILWENRTIQPPILWNGERLSVCVCVCVNIHNCDATRKPYSIVSSKPTNSIPMIAVVVKHTLIHAMIFHVCIDIINCMVLLVLWVYGAVQAQSPTFVTVVDFALAIGHFNIQSEPSHELVQSQQVCETRVYSYDLSALVSTSLPPN